MLSLDKVEKIANFSPFFSSLSLSLFGTMLFYADAAGYSVTIAHAK